MRRLSIRLRVTLAFAAVMALLLGATGVFVYLRFESELDAAINSGLRSRADELSASVRGARKARAPYLARSAFVSKLLPVGLVPRLSLISRASVP